MSEYDSEPIPGLPAHLPDGEEILWQGAPNWRALARRALHVRKVALYFAILTAWSVMTALYDGRGLMVAAEATLWPAVAAGLAIGLLLGLASLIARSTVYTVTNRRVVIRFGVALPMSVNLPFGKIESAAAKIYSDGTGDIPLALGGDARVAFLVMWPHVRPWRIARPQPMLRAVTDAVTVANVLSQALAAGAGVASRPVSPAERRAAWRGSEARPAVPVPS